MFRPLPILIILVLCSCKAYKQDILFRLDDDFTSEDLAKAKASAESNYILRPNDILLLNVFTNKGERLIDPNFEMSQSMVNIQGQQQRDLFQYPVQVDGSVEFPMIGKINVEGMTLFEAEIEVASQFQDIYKDPFVKLRIQNRRVFVLGSPGGQVIPIPNENTSIIEIVATAGGLQLGAKAQNIRLIRNEEVYQIDLSTISGMKETNMNVEPGDVVYIEPWRRPWLETLKDVSPTLSLASSILTLIVVIQNLNQ